MNLSFKELGQFGSKLQVLQYQKVYRPSNLPINNKKEIVFIGKSNVGKSSLINTLLNYKINKTSKTPGCTKWIGFLELPNINIIDLPGYGYSKVAHSRKEFWDKMLLDYIKEKRTLKTFILIDSRRGISELDKEVAALFKNNESEFLFTKHDQKSATSNQYVSCKTGLGIIEFRTLIAAIE